MSPLLTMKSSTVSSALAILQLKRYELKKLFSSIDKTPTGRLLSVSATELAYSY